MTEKTVGELVKPEDAARILALRLILEAQPLPLAEFMQQAGGIPLEEALINQQLWNLVAYGVVQLMLSEPRMLSINSDNQDLLLRDWMYIHFAGCLELSPELAALMAEKTTEVMRKDYGFGPYGEIGASRVSPRAISRLNAAIANFQEGQA